MLRFYVGGAGPHERSLRDQVSVRGEHHHDVLLAPAAEPAGAARLKLPAGVRLAVHPDRVQWKAAAASAGDVEDWAVQGPRHARAGAQHAQDIPERQRVLRPADAGEVHVRAVAEHQAKKPGRDRSAEHGCAATAAVRGWGREDKG